MAQLKAKLTFLADTKQLLKGIGGAEKAMNRMAGGLQRHSRQFMMAGAAMAGALGGLAAQGIAYGTTIDRMAEMTGQAAEDMSRLAYSAELYHGDAAMVEKGTKRLAKAMNDASKGLKTYTDAFDQAGVSWTDGDGKLRSLNDVLLDVADYMASGANETEKLAVSQDLLGGRQSALIPWLKQGSAAIREQFAEADRLGQTLSGETAASMEALGTQLKKVKLAMRGLGVAVATAATPLVDEFVPGIISAVATFNELSPGAKRAKVGIAGIGAAGLLALGGIGRLAPVLGGLTAPLALAAAGATVWGIAVKGNESAMFTQIAALDELATVTGEAADEQLELANAQLRQAAAGAILLEHGLDLNFWLTQLDAQLQSLTSGEGFIAPWRDAIGAMVAEAKQRAADLATESEGLATAAAERAATTAEAIAERIKASLGDMATVSAPSMEGEVFGGDTFQRIADVTAGVQEYANANSTAAMTQRFLAQGSGELVPALQRIATDGFEPAILAAQDFGEFLETTGPQAAMTFMGVTDSVFGALQLKQIKFFKTMKQVSAGFLRESLLAYVRSKTQELVAAKVTEVGKALMQGTLNWAALAAIPGILAAYGTASAALSGIKSFDQTALVTQSGMMTGEFHKGDVIVGPGDVAAMLKGGRGGHTINVHWYGASGPATEGDAPMEARLLAGHLADLLEREPV